MRAHDQPESQVRGNVEKSELIVYLRSCVSQSSVCDRCCRRGGHASCTKLTYTVSKLEICSKFEELEWLQQMRIAQGRIDSNPLSQWAQETSFEIKSRNRYRDVQAWANSRIHLKVPEGHCDYINASPISLHNSKRGMEERYIATQVFVLHVTVLLQPTDEFRVV